MDTQTRPQLGPTVTTEPRGNGDLDAQVLNLAMNRLEALLGW